MLCSLTSFSQVTNSNISGVVKDKKGETIPGTTIQLILKSNGIKYNTSTDVNGIYHIYNANVGGPYSIKITSIGFKPYEKTNLDFNLGDNVLDATLEEENTQLKEVVVVAQRNGIKGSGMVLGEQRISSVLHLIEQLLISQS